MKNTAGRLSSDQQDKEARVSRCLFQSSLPQATAESGKLSSEMAGTNSEDIAQHELAGILQELKKDLLLSMKRLEEDISSKFLETLQPIQTQLQDLQGTLKKTEQKADRALKMGESIKEESKLLKQEISDLKEKNIILESLMKATYLKFRGFPETIGQSEDLITFMRAWLAKVMLLEEGLFPIILKAYRMGSLLISKKSTPRDIVVIFGDERVKQEILLLAKKKGHLQYNDLLIKVFPVIPAEALQIRKKLKATTQKLREEDWRYRWLPSGKLLVYSDGQQYTAYDEKSGEELLKMLNIDDAMDTSKKSQKRKQHLPLTPRKDSKIPVKASH